MDWALKRGHTRTNRYGTFMRVVSEEQQIEHIMEGREADRGDGRQASLSRYFLGEGQVRANGQENKEA